VDDDKHKIVLENNGDNAYLSVKQLIITLKWTADVDLDLMAFYETKDGKKGGVFFRPLSWGYAGQS